MRITALTPQQNNPERYNLFIDGRFITGLDATAVIQFNLQTGLEISISQLQEVQSLEEIQKTLAQAFHFLSYRPRSKAEVERYLKRKEIEPQIIEAVMNKLEDLHYVDDQEFAKFWVENRQKFNPKSSRALTAELLQHGVSKEVAQESLQDSNDVESAIRAGRKKLRAFEKLEVADFRRKLGQFLMRRGFSYSTAEQTVRTLWVEMHENMYDLEEETAP